MQLFQYSNKVMHFNQVCYDLYLLNSNLRAPGNLPSQQEADTMTVNCGIIYVHVYIHIYNQVYANLLHCHALLQNPV